MNLLDAMKTLTDTIKTDLDYAWAWHCNIAMAAYDAGCDHAVANEGAARFMQQLFGVDTRQHPGFPRPENTFQDANSQR